MALGNALQKAYSEPYQTSKMELFAKTVEVFQGSKYEQGCLGENRLVKH